MNASFYVAALGACNQQERLTVVANNLANINTEGYQTKDLSFIELMRYNLNADGKEKTKLQAGAGSTYKAVTTNFQSGAIEQTESQYDYAIIGDGFFMLQNPETNEITYTRNGHFILSKHGENSYLANENGKYVLSTDKKPIVLVDGEVKDQIGVADFTNKHWLENIGENEYRANERNGRPVLVENAMVQDHCLELSNVNIAEEYMKMVESQRAYSYALKMLQTSDEIETVISNLRG